jgi:16S rRNA (guanine966-N2)-methyltransferase
VTRVIAGAARGRRLVVPPGPGTRPTSDRAREGLFSSLQSLTGRDLGVEGASVLDLFAGSGALGLEALSRGAAAATLVEDDPQALRALRANVDAVGLPGATVVGDRVERFLAGPPAPRFDVVLVDPPYDRDVTEVLEALVPWLAPDAVVAVERRTRGGDEPWPPGYQGLRSRRYGEATLWYGALLASRS